MRPPADVSRPGRAVNRAGPEAIPGGAGGVAGATGLGRGAGGGRGGRASLRNALVDALSLPREEAVLGLSGRQYIIISATYIARTSHEPHFVRPGR
jgi:hypothetical protein